MSKRHPIKKEMPPVAKRRGRGRGGPPAADPKQSRDQQRRTRGPRTSNRPTKVITPVRWHPRGEATTEPLEGGGDKPIDVWAGIPGEAGHAEKLFEGRNRITARFVRADDPHPGRRDPPCDRYDLCGGCPFMHMQPDTQADARLALVADALAGAGLDVPAPTELVPSPDGVEGYRHTVKLVVGRSDRGHLRVGAYSRNTHRIVAIPGCNVATPALRRVMSQVAHHIIELDIWPFDPETGRGTLRHIVLRESRSTGEVLVTLVAGNHTRTLSTFCEQLATTASEVVGIHLHLNSEPGNNIFQRDEHGEVLTLNLRGKAMIEEDLAGASLLIGPGDFYQANPGMADRIARDMRDLLEADRARPVVDLYCGVGGLSLVLGQEHGWACGVEVVGGAVLRARENARRNRVQAEFHAGDVAGVLPQLAERLAERHPVLVVDPARRGLAEGVIDAMLEIEPARIAYLSCNPQALARDLADLVGRGWTVRELRAYDMFPQTAHVELLALLDPPEEPPEGRRAPRRRVVR